MAVKWSITLATDFVLALDAIWLFEPNESHMEGCRRYNASYALIETDGNFYLVIPYQNMDADVEFGTMIDFMGALDVSLVFDRAAKRLKQVDTLNDGTWKSVDLGFINKVDLTDVMLSRTRVDSDRLERATLTASAYIISQFGMLQLIYPASGCSV